MDKSRKIDEIQNLVWARIGLPEDPKNGTLNDILLAIWLRDFQGMISIGVKIAGVERISECVRAIIDGINLVHQEIDKDVKS